MLRETYIKIHYTNFRSTHKGICIPYTTYVILNFEACNIFLRKLSSFVFTTGNKLTTLIHLVSHIKNV